MVFIKQITRVWRLTVWMSEQAVRVHSQVSHTLRHMLFSWAGCLNDIPAGNKDGLMCLDWGQIRCTGWFLMAHIINFGRLLQTHHWDELLHVAVLETNWKDLSRGWEVFKAYDNDSFPTTPLHIQAQGLRTWAIGKDKIWVWIPDVPFTSCANLGCEPHVSLSLLIWKTQMILTST